METPGQDLLDYEYEAKPAPGISVVVVGAFLLFFFLTGVVQQYQISSQYSNFRGLIIMVPMLIITFIAGVGLIRRHVIGWYLGVFILSYRIFAQIIPWFLLIDTNKATLGLFVLIVIIFSGLLKLFLLFLFYRQFITSFFEINPYLKILIPLGALILVILMGLMR